MASKNCPKCDLSYDINYLGTCKCGFDFAFFQKMVKKAYYSYMHIDTEQFNKKTYYDEVVKILTEKEALESDLDELNKRQKWIDDCGFKPIGEEIYLYGIFIGIFLGIVMGICIKDGIMAVVFAVLFTIIDTVIIEVAIYLLIKFINKSRLETYKEQKEEYYINNVRPVKEKIEQLNRRLINMGYYYDGAVYYRIQETVCREVMGVEHPYKKGLITELSRLDHEQVFF